MDIEINVDSEAVEKAVVQAVIDSAIGEQMKTAIDKVLHQKGGQFNMDRVLENAIASEIQRVIAIQIREIIAENTDKIRAAVAPQLTDEILLRMSSVAIDFMNEKLTKEY